jgi:predicted MPP superfamily phosphohydrolase
MKKLILSSIVGLSLFAAGCLAYAYFIEPFRLVVNEQRLPVANWNKAFDGLKIVAISDIHGGSRGVTEEKIRQVVDAANAQQPDLIVLLGDFISEQPGDRAKLKMPLGVVAENLRGLKAPLGVFAVLGNHDGWYNDAEVAAALRGVGLRVLENEIAVVEKGGSKLRLLGLRDHLKLTPNWLALSNELKELIAASPAEGDIVVLEHSPDILPIISGDLLISKDLRLILAGHTHGGQVRFPVLGTPVVPSSYGQKYSYGAIRENGVDMFVTTGIGTSILPIRFMMPPEISVLNIYSE